MAIFAKVLHVKMILLWVALLVLIGSNEALAWLAPAACSRCHRRRAASLSKSITLTSISRGQSLSRSTRLFTSSKNVNGDDEKVSSNQVTEDGVAPNKEMDPITKASWYAVEWFGNAFGKDGASVKDKDNVSFSGPPSSLSETLKRIQLDNDRAYFLSGQVDEDIYAPDCVFSDPFVSFEGRDRFVTNLANLGSFITKYDAKVLKYEQPDDTTIETKIMVKLELNLPWKPILAWPWGVKYTVDPATFCIVDHKESWDIEPLEGVKQIFRKPTLKL